MKHAAPAEPTRTGPRTPDLPGVPVCAAAFALPAQRLRDLTREQLAARAAQQASSDAAPADGAGTSSQTNLEG